VVLGAGRLAAAPVVVVDDVVTTGSTLAAAAGALRGAGTRWVAALTAARTPRLTVTTPSLSVTEAPPDVELSLKLAPGPADM
jgi:hypoxanthine phosphoribosyltransferase